MTMIGTKRVRAGLEGGKEDECGEDCCPAPQDEDRAPMPMTERRIEPMVQVAEV